MGYTRQRQMSACKRGVRPLSVRHSAFVAYLSWWRGSRACKGWFRRVAPGVSDSRPGPADHLAGTVLCVPMGWKPWTLRAGVSKAVTVMLLSSSEAGAGHQIRRRVLVLAPAGAAAARASRRTAGKSSYSATRHQLSWLQAPLGLGHYGVSPGRLITDGEIYS
jgi:hypothetical protein